MINYIILKDDRTGPGPGEVCGCDAGVEEGQHRVPC